MAIRYGEPWISCYICGRDIPQSEGVRHYRLARLVDSRCADEPSWTDYREHQRLQAETADSSVQPVPNQGEDT